MQLSTSYDYTYDLLGQLTAVQKNGVLYSSYNYDSNGNRISYSGSQGNFAGTYDVQDRIISYNENTYQYTDNGELQSKTNGEGTRVYNYDMLGNLLSVDLPTGTQIQYIVDGQNRRIGKKVNGSLTNGFIYQDQLKPVAELDGTGNIVARFVYTTKTNVPDYLIKDGINYKILSDYLGSVRLVVNVQSGEVVQRIDYDEFGRVLFNSNPDFQPFGFAGGLYDHETGLVRFGARDYDAETGRWTCKDPIRFSGLDANLYRYVKNNPIGYVDPSGLEDDFPNPGSDIRIKITSVVGKIVKVANKAWQISKHYSEEKYMILAKGVNIATNTINFFPATPTNAINTIKCATNALNGEMASQQAQAAVIAQMGIDTAGTGQRPGSISSDSAKSIFFIKE
jgi:RHS repeat-associated protein